MHLKISAVMLVALLSGCVSTTESTTETVDKPVKKTVKGKIKGASAEHIANSLWYAETAAEQMPPLDATELEDLWQRIQLQLTFTVPQTRPIIEQRNFYSQQQSYLDRVASRAQPFLYYIVQELEKRNMPLELALLPIVESAFDPFAYSPARASGMWQFMPATGSRFGLKQNFWYDGRRDVIESTR
ncbi:transglycosylase SLT domain-containing protein, partial [Arsukibacterium sp.]|uniref:transglycosylase SLT domain-containing protein n=1 Tax=Arsukibacterium sp. TaxID=1977258 RepID=UPI00299E4046